MQEPTMGQTQHRATEVAKTLGRYIKADLAEGLSLDLINRNFPGMTRDELSRVLAICKDEATLEYERAQEMLMSMRETTAGYAALFALIDLWRFQSEEVRSAIGQASAEFAGVLNRLQARLADAPAQKGSELLANLLPTPA
jgi:hypothetical protein